MRRQEVGVNLPIVVIHISHIIVGKVNIHSTGNSHEVEGMQSGDDDAMHSSGKRKCSGSAHQMS